MKSTTSIQISKSILSVVLISIVVLSLGSCARKTNFLISSVVPAARGYVKVKNDSNNNYAIQVHLLDLAEVKRLQPSKETYVVWMITDKQITKNLGQINSSSGLLSKTLKATFETVSSFKPIKIFITAENDPAISYPGTHVVLSTDNF